MRRVLGVVLLVALAAQLRIAGAQDLADLYRHALATNPSLKAREHAVDQARAQRDQSKSRLLPQVSATASYSWNDFDDSQIGERRFNGTRGLFQARQALLDLSAYFRLQGAHASVAQSERQRDALRMALAAEVVDRYLRVLQPGDELGQLQSEKEYTGRQVQRLRLMRERQLAKVTDLYEAEAYYQGLLTREIEIRNELVTAVERLRETTGIAISRLPRLIRNDFPQVSGFLDIWARLAIDSNHTLAALGHAIEAARSMLESGRAEHLPQLGLIASRTYSDQGFDNRSLPGYRASTIGVQVTVPLYEGGRVAAIVREASARLQIARDEHEQARREIERESRTAYLGAVTSYARIASARSEGLALEKVVDAQQRGFELGVSTVVDLLAARRRLQRAHTDFFRACYDYIRDMTNLRLRAGTLAQQHIEEITGWMAQGALLPSGRVDSSVNELTETALRAEPQKK